MTEGRAEQQAAQAFLAGLNDPIAQLARDHGVVQAWLPTHHVSTQDRFGRLVLTIVGQSISVKAATAIYTRLDDLLDHDITPARLAAAGEDTLRRIGLSYAKARAMRELALKVEDAEFDLGELDVLPDDQVQARLVSLRGIGPWSAQMFLLRTLERPDIFPAADVGLRHAIRLLDGLDEIPKIKPAEQRALAWRPWRSYAAKYLWISYDLAVT
jgi:DNA-3-methyladenine glycosylase II